jgi:prolyl-tRNA editing enzyme YbaK/EbsC (Cys-tRNA(Pro) deacylase)
MPLVGQGSTIAFSQRGAEMSHTLSPSAQKIQVALRTLGFPHEVIELPHTTRSAAEAAQAIGCKIEEIAKSLVFKGKHTNRPILVIASGPNRVNEKKISDFLSEPVKMADADFVRQKTGFAIGGVPPLAHRERLETIIDEDLLQFEEIWAAAGTPNAVFRLSPAELTKMTDGRITCVT